MGREFPSASIGSSLFVMFCMSSIIHSQEKCEVKSQYWFVGCAHQLTAHYALKCAVSVLCLCMY